MGYNQLMHAHYYCRHIQWTVVILPSYLVGRYNSTRSTLQGLNSLILFVHQFVDDDWRIGLPQYSTESITHQKLATNWTLQSVITHSGNPCNLETCRRNSPASVLAEGKPAHRMKGACLEKASTTTKIVSFPRTGGRSMIQSMVTTPHGHKGVGRGRRRPGVPPSPMLHMQAGVIHWHKVRDVLVQARPPKLCLQKVEGFYKAKVPCRLVIMTEDHHFFMETLRYK